jgi:hypothetical protein
MLSPGGGEQSTHRVGGGCIAFAHMVYVLWAAGFASRPGVRGVQCQSGGMEPWSFFVAVCDVASVCMARTPAVPTHVAMCAALCLTSAGACSLRVWGPAAVLHRGPVWLGLPHMQLCRLQQPGRGRVNSTPSVKALPTPRHTTCQHTRMHPGSHKLCGSPLCWHPNLKPAAHQPLLHPPTQTLVLRRSLNLHCNTLLLPTTQALCDHVASEPWVAAGVQAVWAPRVVCCRLDCSEGRASLL